MERWPEAIEYFGAKSTAGGFSLCGGGEGRKRCRPTRARLPQVGTTATLGGLRGRFRGKGSGASPGDLFLRLRGLGESLRVAAAGHLGMEPLPGALAPLRLGGDPEALRRPEVPMVALRPPPRRALSGDAYPAVGTVPRVPGGTLRG